MPCSHRYGLPSVTIFCLSLRRNTICWIQVFIPFQILLGKSSSKEEISEICLIKLTSPIMFRRVMVLGSLRCGKISPDSNEILYYLFIVFSLSILSKLIFCPTSHSRFSLWLPPSASRSLALPEKREAGFVVCRCLFRSICFTGCFLNRSRLNLSSVRYIMICCLKFIA